MKLLFTKRLYYLFIFLAFTGSIPVYAQNAMNVGGTVTDSRTGEALIGVSVVRKGSPNGTTTDVNGRYSITNVSQGTVLVFSYLGYERLEIPVTSARLDVKLQSTENVLEEVVVIGYGSVKRKDVSTAISTVTTEDLDRRPIVSAAQAIQGRAAGVSVIQPNGAPGAEMSVRVRGATSFNGSNDPLYVVDGVPVDNIRFLSPNDIASMQVLKDASSAAIYGSRGANGVVLITTEAGKTGEAKIALNAQYTQNRVVNKFDVLNTAQYAELQKEIGSVTLPEGLTDQTNWFDEAYTTGNLQNYQVSISDGTEKLKYLVSGGYVDDQGILNTAFFKRYNFRANVDNKVRDWLTIGANLNYSDYSDNGIIAGTGANRGGVVLSVINTPTFAPVWNPENPAQYYNNFYGANITSPLENMARGKYNKNRENRLLASGSALFTFIPELTLKSQFTLDRRNALNTTFLDPISTSWGRNQYGEASDNRNMNTVLTFDNVLTYSRRFDKHSIEGMAGTSWTDSKYENSYINGSHYRSDQIQTLNAANKIGWENTGSGASVWSMMSYFGRLSYNFDGKYIITSNLRADGSSRLHPDHRWQYFPSFSAAWRLSSEDFLEGTNWLNDLKLRGGWGTTGNQSGIGDFAYLERYNIRRLPWFEADNLNALPTISPANIRTPDLTWERTKQTNVGIDLSAFRSRLTVSLDYYYKRTTDMLMYVTLPAGAAVVGSIVRNEGVMSNKGFEVLVNSRNLEGKFSWDTDFNISFNKNKLEELDLTQIYSAATTSDFISDAVVRNVPGRPLSQFYGYISDGVDPETGDLIYRDLNNDGRISSTDRTFIGDPNPDFIFGLTNNFSWKGFDLSVFVQGSYGNDIFNASRIETEGMYDGKNQTTRVLDRWRVPGQITDVPRAGFTLRNSSYFVEDGSFLRVKNVSLSYNIAGEKLKKMKINRLQPYFSVSNLLTWTNYSGMDPEVNQWGNSGVVQGLDWGTYPQSRSFVLGVNVEF